MDIQTALDNYKILGDYFAPDYEQENEVLNDFKKTNSTLSKQQTKQLVEILKNSCDINEKYFVADLLYLYNSFDEELLEPLLLTAIYHKDPSFNRIFLRPCITVFGTRKTADTIAYIFQKIDIKGRIGILNLLYWLRPIENDEADNLHQVILAKADNTENIVELYYYKLIYSDKLNNYNKIPSNADELTRAIRGNSECEDLLFNKLGWTKSNGS